MQCLNLSSQHHWERTSNIPLLIQMFLSLGSEISEVQNFWRKCISRPGAARRCSRNNHCGRKNYADGTNFAFFSSFIIPAQSVRNLSQ